MPFVVKCCPVIKRWNCCCCSCELRTAALCLGWILMVFSILAATATVIELTMVTDAKAGSDTSLEFESKEWNIGIFVESTVSALLYGVLLFGVHKKKPVYILPSLVFELICIITSMIYNIVVSYTFVVTVGSVGLIYITIAVFATVVTVYVWIVFYSYYRQLEDEKASVSAYRVVHYSHQSVNEDETVQNPVIPTEFHSTANNDLQKIVY